MPSSRAELSVGNLVSVSSKNARYGSMRLGRSGEGVLRAVAGEHAAHDIAVDAQLPRDRSCPISLQK